MKFKLSHSSPPSSNKLFVANTALNFWIKSSVMSTELSLTRQQFSMIIYESPAASLSSPVSESQSSIITAHFPFNGHHQLFIHSTADCTFSFVVRSSLGDRNCTIYCNYCLPAATGYQRFCLFFLLVSDCAVPLQCPWHENVCHLNQYVLNNNNKNNNHNKSVASL